MLKEVGNGVFPLEILRDCHIWYGPTKGTWGGTLDFLGQWYDSPGQLAQRWAVVGRERVSATSQL